MRYFGLFIVFVIDLLCVVFTLGRVNPHLVNKYTTWLAERDYNRER